MESWSQYEEMKTAPGSGEPSIEDLLGVRQSLSDSATELIDPWMLSDVTKKVPVSVEELLGVAGPPEEDAPGGGEKSAAPGESSPDSEDSAVPGAPPSQSAAALGQESVGHGGQRAGEEATLVVEQPIPETKRAADAGRGPGNGPTTPDVLLGAVSGSTAQREEPAVTARRPNRRLDRPDARSTAGVHREALRRHTPMPRNPGQLSTFQHWPLMLVLGGAVAVFAWTDLARLTFGYNSGFEEWLLGVRTLGLALLALGALGQLWRRTAMAIAVAVLLLGIVLMGAYVEYVLHFPFELGDVVPDTKAALDNAIFRVSGFTAATVLFCGWVSWRIWTEVRPKPDEQSL